MTSFRRLVVALLALSVAAAFLGSTSGASTSAPRAIKLRTDSFELSVDGWKAGNAKLAFVNGVVGNRALRVTRTGGSDYTLYRWPYPVHSTVAGATYSARAWIRSDAAKQRVCLRIREWAGGTVTGKVEGCLNATAAWQQLPVIIHREGLRPGLDAYLFAGRVAADDRFDVDMITLTSTAPVAATTTTTPTTTTSPTTTTTTTTAATMTTTTSTTTTTTTTPPPPPAAVPLPQTTSPRFFESSPFNTPIAADAQTDPDSAAMLAVVQSEIASRGFNVSYKAYSTPIYWADASTPRKTVRFVDNAFNPFVWYSVVGLRNVPIPAAAAPSPDSDASLVVVDVPNSRVYEFGRARRDPITGDLVVIAANALTISSTGIYQARGSMTAGGTHYALGKIRPEEMAAGEIRHALAFSFKLFGPNGPVFPATSSDEGLTGTGPPEGARIQLDPTFDLSAYPAWQQTIGRALQRYGMIGTDRGGAPSLYAQSDASRAANGQPAYPWPASDYPQLPKEWASHMRVVKLGAKYATPAFSLTDSAVAADFVAR